MQLGERYHAFAKERTMLSRCESLEPPMSQLGQTLPSRDFCGTAALPLKPDIGERGWHVRKVPLADVLVPEGIPSV
jgi:hypothetical protein